MSQSLIPDIKPLAGQEAVVDLHADDSRISEDETERNGDDGTHDKGLKICRTVTQVKVLHPSIRSEGWVRAKNMLLEDNCTSSLLLFQQPAPQYQN